MTRVLILTVKGDQSFKKVLSSTHDNDRGPSHGPCFIRESFLTITSPSDTSKDRPRGSYPTKIRREFDLTTGVTVSSSIVTYVI